MKYIDAEKLIAEIERRKVILDKYKDSFETAACCKQELKWMEDFISSQQQEQPEVGLEKEIDRVIADYSFTKTIDSGGFKTTFLDYAKIARHFYELGKNSK